uniref:mannose-1-phosphate guanyltransferase alpha-A-like n=1 Tax=Styela clava TaxID=7725 RepID=UPI00193A5A5A|nr:mannose-1-phosphate guanyltransferase alpha-A-like [Styela clava]
MVHHHIEACAKLEEIEEILLVGFYQPSDALNRFIRRQRQIIVKPISYLQEYTMLGTAGCLYHFRDVITSGDPDAFFVLYSDVFCEFPLREILDFRAKFMQFIMMTVEVPREQSKYYGCAGIDHKTNEVVHYIDKPETFVSRDINAGVYFFTMEIFSDIGALFQKRHRPSFAEPIARQINLLDIEDSKETVFDNYSPLQQTLGRIFFEKDVFPILATRGKLFAYKCDRFWMSIKSAGSALYANRAILETYKKTHPDRLTDHPGCIGTVSIHRTAEVDATAVLGPYVTIGAGVVVGPGVRVKNSIVLEGATLKDHCCILNSIIGWHSVVGEWARVEGTPTELDPNAPHATTDNFYLFDEDGRLRPSITILGRDVIIPPEVVIRNSIVMPNKDLSRGFKNQILL